MASIYGIVTRKGEHIDVSRSERGAKQYATRHNYQHVSRRGDGSYHVEVVASKVDGKWVVPEQQPEFNS